MSTNEVGPQIRRVNPVAFATEASTILKAAWQPPSLDYTPEYVQFQCSFPSVLDPVGVAIFEEQNPLGFIAATGRNSNAGELYLSSFLAVLPGSHPASAIMLIRHETQIIQETGRPVFMFVQAGSVGEKLLKCRDSLGMRRVSLGEYRVHAAVPKPSMSKARVRRVPPDEWSVEANRFRDDSLLGPAFTPADMQHFCKDPQGRQFLMAVDEHGQVIATAMRAFTSSVTVTGVMQIPSLHYVRLADQRPDGLAALLAFAEHPASPVVTVPNMAGITSTVAKAVHLRATPSVFVAYLSYSTADAPPFRGTDFEIV
jgi:hypothetical protein